MQAFYRATSVALLSLFSCLSHAEMCEGEPCDQAGPLWLEFIHTNDTVRLEDADKTNAEALAEGVARAETAEERRVLSLVSSWLDAPAGPIDFDNLQGEWRCRTIKVGGILPAIAYRNFDCKMYVEARVLAFDKTSGSQRTSGLIYQDTETSAVYLGKAYYSYEKPKDYGQDGQNESDDVARLKVLDDNHAILIFPAPYHESKMNILELTR